MSPPGSWRDPGHSAKCHPSARSLPRHATTVLPLIGMLHVVNAAVLLAVTSAIVRATGGKVLARRSPEAPANVGSNAN